MSNFIETYTNGLNREGKYVSVAQEKVTITYEPENKPGTYENVNVFNDATLVVNTTKPAGQKVLLKYAVDQFYDEPAANVKNKAIETWGDQLKSLEEGIHPARFNLYYMYGTIDSEYGVYDQCSDGFVMVSRETYRSKFYSETEMYEQIKKDALKKNVGETYSYAIKNASVTEKVSADSTMVQNGENYVTEYTYDDETSIPANTEYQRAPLIELGGGMFEYGCDLEYTDQHNYEITYSCKVAADNDGNKYLTDFKYSCKETSAYKEYRVKPIIRRVGPVSGDNSTIVPMDISYRTDKADPIVNNWSEVEALAVRGGSSSFDDETYYNFTQIYHWE